MRVKRSASVVALLLGTLFGCVSDKQEADLIIQGGSIYSGVDRYEIVEALAVYDGRVIALGEIDELDGYRGSDTQVITLSGSQAVYPGFIEGHGHLAGLGSALKTLDLSAVESFAELCAEVAKAAENQPEGEWIIGWGWHQSKWSDDESSFVQGFPSHQLLSQAVPNHPVYLMHASGHASMVNANAMNLTSITEATEYSGDGQVIKDSSGAPTGVLNENAMYLVSGVAMPETVETAKVDIRRAVAHAHQYGVTGFHDAGTLAHELQALETLAQNSDLGLRVYSMLSSSQPELLEQWLDKAPLIDAYDNFLTVRSIKIHGDGALGSRGAWLHEEYSDQPGHFGMPTYPMDGVEILAKQSLEAGYQLNVHAIGDRTNTEVLDRFAKVLAEHGTTDHRFRIEHAQHLTTQDIQRFAKLGVIPSMQAIHMSSDRPWAIDRLGKARIESGAYMWSDLLDTGVMIINGTDVPIEPISPIANFYASITRRTLAGLPEGGYEPQQKMTREEALKSLTYAPAFGAFQEADRGFIGVGALADFVILDRDILNVAEDEVLETSVVATIIDGRIVYEASL